MAFLETGIVDYVKVTVPARADVASVTRELVATAARTSSGRTSLGSGQVPGAPLSAIPGATHEASIQLASTGDSQQSTAAVINAGSELVRSIPGVNAALVANTTRNASTVASQGADTGVALSVEDRSVGMFERYTGPATIEIKSFTNGVPSITVNQFILTSTTEASQEKYQIFQTYDEDFLYLFDRNPHIYTYGGVLVNGDDRDGLNFNWRNRFQAQYDSTLRGTKCVDTGAEAILRYGRVERHGYLLNCQMSEDARNPMNVPFSFVLFVTKQVNNVNDTSLRPVSGG